MINVNTINRNIFISVVMGSYMDYLVSWDHVIRTNKELEILVVYYESLIKVVYLISRNVSLH